MSRFQDEVDIIPRPAYIVGMCLWVWWFLGFMLVPFRVDPELRQWPMIGKLAISMLGGLFFLMALLIGYVYADAKRRGMRYVLWTWLAALIPNAIGIVLYFILREPLLAPCPHCGTQARQGYAFCQNCGAALAITCPQCRRAVEPGWSHCVGCGAALRGA